jgi:hypothetical protein
MSIDLAGRSSDASSPGKGSPPASTRSSGENVVALGFMPQPPLFAHLFAAPLVIRPEGADTIESVDELDFAKVRQGALPSVVVLGVQSRICLDAVVDPGTTSS